MKYNLSGTLLLVLYFWPGQNMAEGNILLLKAGQEAEKCYDLKDKQQLNYYFKSPLQIEFNIHYHSKNSIFFPVFPQQTDSKQESLTARSDHSYCLQWKNISKESIEIIYWVESLSQE